MSTVSNFAEQHRKEWKSILEAQRVSEKNIGKIREQLASEMRMDVTSTDADLVLFGSIARGECTSNSDVDWTLLIDGQADPNHITIGRFLEKAIIATGLSEPGISGLFGQNTFSHDLIHYIGGQDDTNHNLSRRILLLLESCALSGSMSGSARDRVIRGIIAKYIDNDSGYVAPSKENVPRFLLNDLIRFWRTMCVDFAYKQIEQEGEKWALRNIKLRFSRRLIFVKGLLMCASLYKTKLSLDEIKEKIFSFTDIKPIDFLLAQFKEHGIRDSVFIDCMDAYNWFLELLNDESKRDYLKNLNMYQAYDDEVFKEAREKSHIFQHALNSVFLDKSNRIGEFALKYGIF